MDLRVAGLQLYEIMGENYRPVDVGVLDFRYVAPFGKQSPSKSELRPKKFATF